MPFFLDSLILPCLFLLGTIVLTACSTAFLRLGKFKSKEQLRAPRAPLFFFLPILRKFFGQQEWENLHFSISVTKHIFGLAYAVSLFFYLIDAIEPLHQALLPPAIEQTDWHYLLAAQGGIILLFLLIDFLARLLTSLWPRPMLRLAAPLASLFLLLLFPLVGPLLRLTRGVLHKVHMEEELAEQLPDKTQLREIISESELQRHLDAESQKLISAFINFKQRVAKEIMVPRVNLYALEEDISIREATSLFASEGYSRIPIYRESLDQITGVVLYKDLLKYYANPASDFNSAIKSIAKPVLYSPENKKIPQLLQEFRNQQIHMAIIVDEYGGTEGIVTIEDILEELVGEIEDEYDIATDRQFWEMPQGGWIVDAKMTLLDIEDHLGIQIPPSPEYETIGGYVFHCAGTIPAKGWKISHDDFDLEVLSSNERSLKKIKIVPRTA